MKRRSNLGRSTNSANYHSQIHDQNIVKDENNNTTNNDINENSHNNNSDKNNNNNNATDIPI
jgi:hypothetical protein